MTSTTPTLAQAEPSAGRPEILRAAAARIGPDDPRYADLAGKRFNKRYAGRPDYVCLVGSTRQVVDAVQEAVRENLAIARSNPELWADLKQKFHAYRASFGAAAPPQRIYALALNQAIGQATGAIDVGEGFFAHQARAFGSSVSADAASAYIEASYRSFVVEFTRTGDLGGAARRAAERAVLAITPDDVKQAVPAGPEAHTDFGIANAIQRNDVREALREVGRSLDAGMVPFFILGQLRIAAQRLPARRVKSAVEAVFRTDIALKSSGGDPRILIERLVVEMCEGRRA